MLLNLLNGKSKSVASAAVLVGFFALLSRILGLLRDRILAGRFGAGDELDVYYAAFRLPDLVFNLFIFGSISVAFIPIFLETYRSDKQRGWETASRTLNFLLFSLIFISALLILAAPILIDKFIAPGFDPSKKAEVVAMSRILFLSPLFLGLSSFLTALLQTFRRFLITSLAPIMYNIGIIIGALFLVDFFGIYGLAWGVVLGAFLNFLIQLPAIREFGFKFRPRLDFWVPEVKKILRLMIPRTLGLATFQINSIVITAIISTLKAGSLTIFSFADNLQSLPVGIIGVAFSTAVFPALVGAAAKKQLNVFKDRFSATFRQIVFFTLPSAFLFFLLRDQIVYLVLRTGQFSRLDGRLTAAILGVFCFGVLTQGLSPLIAKSFYALQNTKTPAVIGAVSVGVNVVLAVLFIYLFSFGNLLSDFLADVFGLRSAGDFRIIALPVAVAVSSLFNTSLLLKFLSSRLGGFGYGEIASPVYKMLIASAAMAAGVYPLLYVLTAVMGEETFLAAFIQGFSAAVAGAAIYFLVAKLFRLREADAILRRLKNIF
ncbi:murein biosynthesis integral membrane protein MurJ [Candidatus Azambacteria bacterium RIFCSPHIGHO2_01_46_10]|uniref:Probable lipid II flippase MurJ n=8 Tax=Candidatus Azamiibacteriota TaxID=1752741 RepID=A0A0G1Q6C4_9BACT|nr:MAG: hypothetical protein UX27_C0004G0004 [Candidatus Azambacteria bacterium GW2011_GWA2_45_90]KKU22471.1 MAG: hypothetical protein UX33_C0011G0011 [Candidatus Azambacteria bacterium GW2011_GWC1_46_13]KKU36600.1 MAG: hypothetical protein UX48_C0002G0015 [Candidatus Azambacteria bacterium GW2011_GWB1_46_27]KKU37557.1 MAG: hypothetical protein UX51_C0018G0007 [Candidatus Azambacteria bacterium GW2011_GWF2_46_32]KKU39117.1 MAG: hypothetical protein UX53_C0014G0007 [Candidatus Azambacteria bacte